MLHLWLADLVVGIHLAFVAFVVLGGLIVLLKPKVGWVHAPAAAWGVAIEFAGLICPLTPLEVEFRHRAGEAGYEGGFVEHYLSPILYPPGLTRGPQIALGAFALILNAAIYGWLFARRLRRRSAGAGPRDGAGPA